MASLFGRLFGVYFGFLLERLRIAFGGSGIILFGRLLSFAFLELFELGGKLVGTPDHQVVKPGHQNRSSQEAHS